ncbi:type VII toxin-antitoxin system HepT family RNase toxin [Georgenia yuyongxinii]|uniref:DUF86 domain-containing protein n=1 Tax=Georgenia yuyongxinii TaxID=2589797 RepID=A0A552WT16_9MICO|nr:DUF86 domain-containing protein [Georgenia yuyongxinii]TRW45988.1 DUF86 domain-containing protein [Georgenia yuyongxinii]
MVDDLRVLRLLRAITDDLAVLRQEVAAPPERAGDPLWIRGVKYTFVTAIEASVDIAQHLCASQGWGPPSDNAGAIRLLGRHGVLGNGEAEVVARAVGFRNVLVHEYVAVDDDIVRSRLADLGDLEAFVSAVGAWVEANR